jgi:Adaptive response protein AidB N-terminal domain
MPSRFTSGVYEPEIATLMGEAFELAWKDARWTRPPNQTLAKRLLASAIIAGVEAGVSEPRTLAKAATKALRKVASDNPAALDGEG